MISSLYQFLKYLIKKTYFLILSLLLPIDNRWFNKKKKITAEFSSYNVILFLRRNVNKTYYFNYPFVITSKHFRSLFERTEYEEYESPNSEKINKLKAFFALKALGLNLGSHLSKPPSHVYKYIENPYYYFKTNFKFYNHFVKRYKLGRYKFFFYLLFFYFLLFYLEKYDLFHLKNLNILLNNFKYSNKFVYSEFDFNIFIYGLKKNKLHVFNKILIDSYYFYRVERGFLMDVEMTADFKYRLYGRNGENSRFRLHIAAHYIKFIFENFFTLSRMFLKQYISCFLVFLYKHSYLYFIPYLEYLDYEHNLSNININLLNKIKDYLFWFSWGIFYNKIFYYYYSNYLIENIDLNISNYFYYKLSTLKFLKLKNLGFIDNGIINDKDIQKNDENFFISTGTRNLFDWFIGETYKRWLDFFMFRYIKLSDCFDNFDIVEDKHWFVFQNYIINDLYNYYNHSHNSIDFFDNMWHATVKNTYMNKSFKIINRNGWLVFYSPMAKYDREVVLDDEYYWLDQLFDDELDF